jgi:3-hydroxyisobutyrate dehydrogenase-like beta-hydroxyacid dehydrogenase
MGAAVGAALRTAGYDVVWASEGRSAATRRRAEEAGLRDAGSAAEVAAASEVLFSVCPPHAALDVARGVASFDGVYVDANAVSPATAREVGGAFARFVDGGIVGGPPDPRLYLSGADASFVAGLFEGSPIEARVLDERVGSASALKMTYAAWTKGAGAMVLAIRAVAEAEGVGDALVAEWSESLPRLEDRLGRAQRSAEAKGWRWVGEMEEIAATFEAAGLPAGFHEAAAEIYRGYARPSGD